MTNDPLADLKLQRAQPHFERLRTASDELRIIRDQLEPIYNYYFPPTWTQVFKRMLRLVPQPDFSRHVAELKRLRDAAWGRVESAKRAVEDIHACEIEPALWQATYLSYKQVDLDGATVILFYEYVRAMDQHDPEAMTYFAGVKQSSDQARANLAELQRHASALARSVQ